MPATVVNQGTLHAGNYRGVELGQNGDLVHGAVGATTARIYGLGGAYGGPAGTVVNYATIHGRGEGIELVGGNVSNNGTAASISSGGNAIFVTGAAGTIANSGTISGGGEGILLTKGGSVANNGTAALISASYGIYNHGAAGTVTNAGTIMGFFTDIKFSNYNNTLTNAGTIIGGAHDAVALAAATTG